jgi:hypothetical protein
MRAHARLRLYSPSLYAASKQLAGKRGAVLEDRSWKETGPEGGTDGSARPYVAIPCHRERARRHVRCRERVQTGENYAEME